MNRKTKTEISKIVSAIAILVIVVSSFASSLTARASGGNDGGSRDTQETHQLHSGDEDSQPDSGSHDQDSHDQDDKDDDDHEGVENPPPPPPPPVVQLGSISICKMIADADGNVLNGNSTTTGSGTFSISGFVPNPPSSSGVAAGTLPQTSFSFPFAYNAKVISQIVNDAQFVKYGSLTIGHYFYGQESVTGNGWLAPKYNDQLSVPVHSTNDFFAYSGELFDSNAANDGARNQNADGDIVLTAGRPDRTLVLLNRIAHASSTPTSTPPTTGSLKVVVVVVNDNGGTNVPGDFTVSVTGTNPSVSSFPGNASGTSVTLGPGTYSVGEATSTGYAAAFSGDCSGTIAAGDAKTCTVTNDDIVVVPPPGGGSTSTLSIIPTALADGTVGTVYGAALHASGIATGTFTWSVASGTLPTGLALSTSTNATTTISGTPNATGTFSFTIKVVNGSSSAEQAYTVTINASSCTSNCGGGGNPATSTLAITPNVLPDGTTGTSYSQALNATGIATGPFTWSVTSGALPTGLSLDTSATGTATTITGTPNATGTFAFTVTVQNGTSAASQSYTVLIAAAACATNCGGGNPPATSTIAITPATLPDGTNGTEYSQTLTAIGISTGTITWSVSTGTLPTGLTLGTAATGATTTISGMPTETGIFTFTVHVADGANTATQAYAITINAAAVTPTTGCTSNCGGRGGGGGSVIGVGGGYPGNPPPPSGGGGGGGSITPPTGQVLGASSSSVPQVLGESCGIYLKTYIRRGKTNDAEDVKRLQIFLNKEMGTNLPITGFYGAMTEKVVNDFQVKYADEVLSPWVPYGLKSKTTPTGYVYKTTQRWINLLSCPVLGLPIPALP